MTKMQLFTLFLQLVALVLNGVVCYRMGKEK